MVPSSSCHIFLKSRASGHLSVISRNLEGIFFFTPCILFGFYCLLLKHQRWLWLEIGHWTWWANALKWFWIPSPVPGWRVLLTCSANWSPYWGSRRNFPQAQISRTLATEEGNPLPHQGAWITWQDYLHISHFINSLPLRGPWALVAPQSLLFSAGGT